MEIVTALNAVVEAAEGRWQKAVCLRDWSDTGPVRDGVIDRIQELGAITIRGNHDNKRSPA